MEKQLIDTSTIEGKMLYLAVANLMSHPTFTGMGAEEIVRMLAEGVEQLQDFKM